MTDIRKNPRILIVTPEVTTLPDRMGWAAGVTAKAGGLADVSAALVNALFEQGADVHVALPDYRSLFHSKLGNIFNRELKVIRSKMPDNRIHLAEDRIFYYLNQIYSGYGLENMKAALAFQREVINNIIPQVEPDLIHCNDWMTGLIPALARQMGIPSLFTIHNIHTVKCSLAFIEDRGIDAAAFWKHLFFVRPPYSYEESRENNEVDFLVSGVFSAHFANTVSATFLDEITQGRHDSVEKPLQAELINKYHAGCAAGILNAPDPSFNPETDEYLAGCYGPENHVKGKRQNKLHMQKTLGLIQDPDAPLFFWPSRLDRVQKGCQLLADILYDVISAHWEKRLQIVFVANGEFQEHFKNIVRFHNFYDRVAICHFDERLERLGYGAADFVLMPSRFEPCGLPQMIGAIYGALPVAHDTGGLHDTIRHLDAENDSGNGFLFETHDAGGLRWAMEQAVAFHALSSALKAPCIARIMKESLSRFNHSVTARHYIDLYEKMLQRPLTRMFE